MNIQSICRCFLLVLFFIQMNTGLLFAQQHEKGAQKPPNIVLIMADDMGYECLSTNGCLSYQTPNLDNLAKKGIKFNYTISQPLCTPSRVKIMTGKYNYRNYKAFEYLDVNERTFGNILKDAGYETCVVGKWQLNGVGTKFESTEEELWDRPHHFGFDEYCLWNFIGSKGNKYGNRFTNPRLYQNGKQLDGFEDAYGPDVVSDYAVDFIKRKKDKPFFLYYPMLLVHSPFVPTPDSKEWSNKDLRLKQDNRFFKDMVEYTDKIVQKLVDAVEEQGLSNNTIIIFTGDNGTHISITTQTVNGAFPGGKGTMPDAGTHVPMIVYNPSKIKKGFEYNELFEFSDFVPTLAQIAGVPIPENLDGKSFYPLFTGQDQAARKTVFVHYDPLKVGGAERWYGRFVRNKYYKLYNDGRFYNISKDTKEIKSIIEDKRTKEENELVKQFQEELYKAPPFQFKQPEEYKKETNE
jgi:arylsulfatase A